MDNKNLIYLILIVIFAGLASYVYFYGIDLPWAGREAQTVYTKDDFPHALEVMDDILFTKAVADLNREYDLLVKEDRVYIRLLNIGIIKKSMLDFEGAEQAWLSATDYNADQYVAFGNFADLYLYHLKKIPEAEQNYKHALELRPDFYNYYIGLASLYRYDQPADKDRIEPLMLAGAELNPNEQAPFFMYLSVYFSEDGNDLVKARFYRSKTLEQDSSLIDQLPDL